jgi:hypothetical protein
MFEAVAGLLFDALTVVKISSSAIAFALAAPIVMFQALFLTLLS